MIKDIENKIRQTVSTKFPLYNITGIRERPARGTVPPYIECVLDDDSLLFDENGELICDESMCDYKMLIDGYVWCDNYGLDGPIIRISDKKVVIEHVDGVEDMKNLSKKHMIVYSTHEGYNIYDTVTQESLLDDCCDMIDERNDRYLGIGYNPMAVYDTIDRKFIMDSDDKKIEFSNDDYLDMGDFELRISEDKKLYRFGSDNITHVPLPGIDDSSANILLTFANSDDFMDDFDDSVCVQLDNLDNDTINYLRYSDGKFSFTFRDWVDIEPDYRRNRNDHHMYIISYKDSSDKELAGKYELRRTANLGTVDGKLYDDYRLLTDIFIGKRDGMYYPINLKYPSDYIRHPEACETGYADVLTEENPDPGKEQIIMLRKDGNNYLYTGFNDPVMCDTAILSGNGKTIFVSKTGEDGEVKWNAVARECIGENYDSRDNRHEYNSAELLDEDVDDIFLIKARNVMLRLGDKYQLFSTYHNDIMLEDWADEIQFISENEVHVRYGDEWTRENLQ